MLRWERYSSRFIPPLPTSNMSGSIMFMTHVSSIIFCKDQTSQQLKLWTLVYDLNCPQSCIVSCKTIMLVTEASTNNFAVTIPSTRSCISSPDVVLICNWCDTETIEYKTQLIGYNIMWNEDHSPEKEKGLKSKTSPICL